MSIRVDGVMVLTGVGVLAIGCAAYFIKKKVGAVLDLPEKAIEYVSDAVKQVNNAVPPGMTFEQKQLDGSVKPVTVTGQQIKEANANKSTMGMIAWPTSLAPSSWYSGLGYSMESWEADNPFANFDDIADSFVAGENEKGW
jgi:hypothetical protein